MGGMTLAVDATAKPVGLVSMESAVSRLAQVQQAMRDGTPLPYHCQVLEEDTSTLFRSAGNPWEEPIEIPAPIVMMWPDYVELQPHETSRVTRRVLFARDRFQCAYCDFTATPRNAFKVLTVDHVKPTHLFKDRSESTVWSNVATACQACNRKKGGKLPYEVHMYPRVTPKEPHYVQLRFAGRLNEAQRDYVAQYFKINPDEVHF